MKYLGVRFRVSIYVLYKQLLLFVVVVLGKTTVIKYLGVRFRVSIRGDFILGLLIMCNALLPTKSSSQR